LIPHAAVGVLVSSAIVLLLSKIRNDWRNASPSTDSSRAHRSGQLNRCRGRCFPFLLPGVALPERRLAGAALAFFFESRIFLILSSRFSSSSVRTVRNLITGSVTRSGVRVRAPQRRRRQSASAQRISIIETLPTLCARRRLPQTSVLVVPPRPTSPPSHRRLEASKSVCSKSSSTMSADDEHQFHNYDSCVISKSYVPVAGRYL